MATQRPNYQGGAPLDFSQVTQGLTQIILGQQQAAAAAAAEERKRNDQLYSAVEDLAYKIDPSGVRSADVQIFTDRYNEEVRGTMIDALVARQQGDMRRFTTLVTQAKENIRKLNIDINSNKKISEQEAKLLEDMRRYPERYTQEDKDRLERRLSMSYREIPDDLSIDSPSWGRRIDTSRVPGQINKIVEDLLKHQGQSTGVTSRRFGDNTQYIDNLSLSAGVAASALLAHENDPTFRAYFEQQYPGVDYQTAVQAHVSGMVADGRLSKQESLAVNRDRRDGMTESSAVGDLVTGLDIAYGDSTVTAPRYVGIQSGNVALAGTPAINLTTGERVEKIPANITDTRIVGLAELPVLDANIPRQASIAAYQGPGAIPNSVTGVPLRTGPRGQTQEVLIVEGKVQRGRMSYTEQFAIDRNAMPSNLSNNKVVRAAVAKFDAGKAPVQQRPTDNTTRTRRTADDL